MKRSRKVFYILVCAISICFMQKCEVYAEDSAHTRVIQVVYDDSGSMIKNSGGESVDTWCQAKYAMEVFAALLGEQDTLNVYVMSDFNNGATAEPHLILNGKDGAEVNVEKIHNMITRASNTPFNTVKKAYEDLKKAQADEKWLVVLTDGKFQGIDNIDSYFAQKADDVNVLLLGMGPEADSIQSNEEKHIYFEKAQTNQEILKKITEICTRVLNSDRIEISVSKPELAFDIPMAELTVFAQGANVSIEGIETPSGDLMKSSNNPVSVKYSETAAVNYTDDIKIAKNLVGSIATYKGDFESGKYKIKVSGAETIEVYYKPNVEIAAYLYTEDGKEVTDISALESGIYKLQFGFVKSGTTEKVAESKLLGDIQYHARIENNGEIAAEDYHAGDEIQLEEGTLAIDATAQYLDYHTVSTHLDYSIYRNKKADFQQINHPDYALNRYGFDTPEPIQIEMTLDGNDISPEQWEQIHIPEIESLDEEGLCQYEIIKTEVPGRFELIPAIEGDTLSDAIYTRLEYQLSYSEKQGEETWSGGLTGEIEIDDTRSWLERNYKKIKRAITFGILGIIILGYMPFCKKYLPRKLKAFPGIDCEPKSFGVESRRGKGAYTRNVLTTLIPYKAETGTLRFVPRGVSGIPAVHLKGAGGKRMYITNIQVFAGKEGILFGGSSIPSGTKKPLKTTAGIIIVVETPEMTYTCIPTRKY